MRKLLSWMLVAVMLITAVPVFAVSAEAAPAFVVESTSAMAGDTVTVAVSTENNPGIISLKLQVGYDADVLELKTITAKDFVGGQGLTHGPLTANPVTVNWLDPLSPDNTTDGVVAQFTFKVKDDAPIGDTAITVDYDADDVYNAAFDNVTFAKVSGAITVKELTAIEVTEPNKTTYYEGETFDPTGMIVTAKYSDGSRVAVEDYTVTGYDSLPGTKTITVSYEGKTASFTVVVEPKAITSIAVTTLPTKVVYLEGQSLNTAGMVVTAYFTNHTTEVITDYTVSGYDSVNAGVKTVTVAYAGFTTTFNVTVNEAAVDDTTPLFVVESKSALVGKTVTLTVSVKNNPGIVSAKLMVGYDANVFELVSLEGADFSDTAFGPTTANPVAVNWCDVLHPNNTTDGVLAKVTLKVKDDAPVGDTKVYLSYDADDVYDYDFNNVEFATVKGTVTVKDYTPGDVTGDGKINNKDLGVLLQHLNGWSVDIIEEAGDVTGDGKINNKDLGILLQHLNGWDVELK